MSKIHLRVWPNGAFTATERKPGESVSRVFEFDGRSRYHSIILGDRNWTESEFRLDKTPHGTNPKFFLKQSKSERSGRILTTWQAASRKGGYSKGQTTILANNSIRWSQEIARRSVLIKAQGDGFTSSREITDPNGGSRSQTRQQPSGSRDLGTKQSETVNADGSTTTVTVQNKTASDGAPMQRTTTTTSDASGQVTNQSVSVTKQNNDGSTATQTMTTDNVSNSTTTSNTVSDGQTTVAQTTVTDNNTGQSVTTQEGTTTSTDAQGNTVTAEGQSVTSSDGFSSSLVTVTSSDGSSGYMQSTTDGQGNSSLTTSTTDPNGNTDTTNTQTDASGNSTVTSTSTDANGNGTQTTETYDANGNLTSSDTSSVGSSGGGSGSGSGDSGGSGGGSGDSGGGSGDGGMSNPDDGTDEGPRSPTRRVSMGQGATDPVAGIDDSGGTGDDYGGEGEPRNLGIGKYLEGYSNGTDDSGWGDASSENAPSPPQVDLFVNVPSATDDWGDLNNPRAFGALAQSLMVSALKGSVRTAAGGIVVSMAAIGQISAQVAGIATEIS